MPSDPRSPRQSIASITVLVDDCDAAIAYYTDVLGFDLVEDTATSPTARRVLVAPPGSREARLRLAPATTDEQRALVGRQAGGSVLFVLQTRDFAADYRRLAGRGVPFDGGPRAEPLGWTAVFVDRYGNRWELVERPA
jgi:catechol 2,3-dioxygenase-like lactoylglutathione lyase family enzyme